MAPGNGFIFSQGKVKEGVCLIGGIIECYLRGIALPEIMISMVLHMFVISNFKAEEDGGVIALNKSTHG